MLKSLELFGFKSFADRTVFDFPAGITGVVGPNGSGKSNVVDSIKWILGDQSAKSLRGKEMTDVIFNGSSGRAGSQFAEATLTFDNRSRFIPLELDEVSVGRRLWQSGDSEYLVNGGAARLKDIRELFSGTGAGAAAWCIIEQGRVDQILQSNAANRRLIFEEAAGVSRLRTKRTEALKRLERVEQNLTRLADLVEEVETQVNSVRSQAQRATKYQAASRELEALWVGLAADDYRRESVQRDELQRLQSGAAGRLEQLKAGQQRALAEVQQAERELVEVDERLRELEQRRSEVRSRLASLETTQRYQISRDTELQSDLQRLSRQQQLLRQRVQESELEQSTIESSLTSERAACERRRQQVQAAEHEIAVVQQSLAGARAQAALRREEQLRQLQINSGMTSELAALRNQVRQTVARREVLRQRSLELGGETDGYQRSVPLLQTRLEQTRADLQQAEDAADQLLMERDKLLGERTEGQQSLAELREQRSGLLARRAVLEDLEDRQEGFGIGVREILRRAEESNVEPWNQILGSVADLLDVDMEQAALLEIALSGRAQLLVVAKLQPLIDYLNSGRARITDRVGFVSIESAGGCDAARLRGELRRGQTAPWQTDAGGEPGADELYWNRSRSRLQDFGFSGSEARVAWSDGRSESAVARSVFCGETAATVQLFGQPGIVGRADGLARSPQSMPDLASHLLADTWVAETLADALHWHAALGGAGRFVTLQGELVESDGTLFAGTVRNESALLSRKSELRRLRNDLHRLEHEIAQRELLLRTIAGSISSTDDQLQAARVRINQQVQSCREAEAALAEQQRLLQDCERRERALADDGGQIELELQQLEQRQRDAQSQLESGQHLLQALENRIREVDEAVAERQGELQQLERGRTESSLELTRLEERLAGLQDSFQPVRDELEQRRQQLQEADRRLAAATERRRDLLLSQLNTAAETAERLLSEEQLSGAIVVDAACRGELRSRRQQASETEQQAREVLRREQERVHEVELRMQGIDHLLSSAADRIREEFQLEVREAVEQGRSAIAVWLRQQQPADSGADTAGRGQEAALFDASAAEVLQDEVRFTAMRSEVEQQIEKLRKQLRKLGHVGAETLENLQELESRFQRLQTQLQDLEAARDALREMVRRINVESRRMFLESFETIRGYFRELFRRLFGGGEADLVLEDPEDVLECSIDVVARPPGKELRSISLLSGGEKTLTAVALLLSIFRSRSSPFCLLDEVDAALDDANIGRFVNVLRDFQQNTQFIMITHRKPTMAVTDVLYGVTMEESGISRRLSLRFEDVDEQGNFLAAARRQKAA